MQFANSHINVMRTLIVDDEPEARKGLKRILSNHSSIDIVGEAYSSNTFINKVRQFNPDLIVLDIMLRDTNSLDALDVIGESPLLIITTAYDNHALRGFDHQAVDYLMKPISEARLYGAINRAYALFSSAHEDSDCLFLKSEGRYIRFRKSEILYIKGLQNYVVIHTSTDKYVCKTTLKTILELLGEKDFTQIHKSYIVNLKKVDGLEKQTIFINDCELPIGKTMKSKTYKLLLNT